MFSTWISTSYPYNDSYSSLAVERTYRGADKSLARPGKKQARKHVRDARDFNKIETRAVIKFLFLQGKAPKEIDAILTEILACFHPRRARDLSALLYGHLQQVRTKDRTYKAEHLVPENASSPKWVHLQIRLPSHSRETGSGILQRTSIYFRRT